MILARVEWTGVKEAQTRIERRIFSLSGRDSKMYGDIQRVVYQSTAVNFAAQGRPNWAKRKSAYAWPILAKTGRLFDSTLSSILRPWEHLNAVHRLNIWCMFYGVFHQYGQGQKKRPFVRLMAQERRDIGKILNASLRGAE